MALAQIEAAGGRAHQYRAGGDDGFGQRQLAVPALVALACFFLLDGLLGGVPLLAGLIVMLVDIGGQFDAGYVEQRLEAVRVGFYQEDVALAQHLVGRRHALALVAADQGDHLHVGFLLHRTDQRVQGAPGVLATLRHAHFGEVGADLEEVAVAFLFLAPRHQAPAEQGNEQHAGDRHRGAHRQEGEHAEGRLAGLGAVAGDDQVGRGAD